MLVKAAQVVKNTHLVVAHLWALWQVSQNVKAQDFSLALVLQAVWFSHVTEAQAQIICVVYCLSSCCWEALRLTASYHFPKSKPLCNARGGAKVSLAEAMGSEVPPFASWPARSYYRYRIW